MSFTFDDSTDAGRVRLLITDVDSANAIFQDSSIDAFLDMEGGSIRRAAAMALETIARNEVLILKVIKILDLTTDGAKVGAELRASAKSLRESDDEQSAFAIIGMVDSQTAWEERMRKNAMRGAV